MEEKVESSILSEKNLLDIFKTDKDLYSNDLMEMSDFFNIFIENIADSTDVKTSWEDCSIKEDIIASIATAMKVGLDISKWGMLIADYSHLKPETIEGLKKGTLHLAQTKEGDAYRAVIVNDKNTIVQQLTLKQAVDPSAVLGDVSMLAMQMALHELSVQINRIGKDLSELMDSIRQDQIYDPFVNARYQIKRASNAEGIEQGKFLDEADKYLREGLTNLYDDFKRRINELAQQTGLRASLKEVDKTLAYINEDFLLISNYIGMSLYLFYYRKRYKDAMTILDEYIYWLKNMNNEKLKGLKCSAFELIHEYYPYNKKNRDFWLEKPKQVINALNSYEMLLDKQDQDVYYIIGEGEI